MMDLNLKESIRQCVGVRGLSGREASVAEYFMQRLDEIGIKPYRDSAGNVRGKIKCGNENAATILLEAHMDQIGLMTSGIDDEGYVKFENLGGIDERLLCGTEVKILGAEDEIHGVITALSRKDDNGNPAVADISQLRIDVGLDKEKADKCIKTGDGIVIDFEFTELLDEKLSSAAMDNRAGAAAVLECAKRAMNAPIMYDIEIAFTTQEELGLHGAFVGIEPESADVAIAVDVTHGTTPDSKDEAGVFDLGSGAVICRGPNLHYEYTKQLIKTAEDNNIPYDIEVASGGSGTTAWAIQTIGNGIPVMLVSIPLKYMHTNVETLKPTDVRAVSDLLFAAISGGIKID